MRLRNPLNLYKFFSSTNSLLFMHLKLPLLHHQKLVDVPPHPDFHIKSRFYQLCIYSVSLLCRIYEIKKMSSVSQSWSLFNSYSSQNIWQVWKGFSFSPNHKVQCKENILYLKNMIQITKQNLCINAFLDDKVNIFTCYDNFCFLCLVS